MFSNSKIVLNEIRQRQSTCRKSVDLFLLLRTSFLLIFVFFVRTSSPQETKAMIYLSQYGYLPPSVSKPSSGNLLSQEALSNAVAEFQNFAGLNVTGELDEETLKLMETPRCGVKDKVGFATDSRSKRYALQGSRWKVRDLTYKISKYPRALKKEHVDSEVKKAFGVWSKYTDLTFTQKKVGSVHIEIRFERGEHGDGDPFDGRGGTLAHAYFPVYGGDAHFDDDEVWTIDSFSGTNLFQVAAHEFGHSLGLSHSDVRAALMAPFYRGYQPYFELHEDDIEGIQALYGKKTRGGSGGSSAPKPTTESPNSVYDDPELCSSPTVDTIFNGPEKQTYVFRKDKYWKLTSDGVARGYPKLISKSWPGLPSNIDAAFTYKNGKTYFFKGKDYWRYTGKKMDGDYPKPISKGFEGIPDNIDAALVWGGNGKIYFFKDDKFWKFDPSAKPPVKKTYPKPISNWDGIPDKIDAALQYTNGYTYFFKKGAYWRFNDRNFMVDEGNPAFPRSSAHWWFGCKSATRDTLAGGPEEKKTPGYSDSSSDVTSPRALTVLLCLLLFLARYT
ncbi:UNVERIFIED_CONTAM: hypothetical protein PYX00_002545 [Menopon gallinae]|uniref:Peptidase metallopeptidase domain-containing protein n=1 Tax=Menopon gallinae TaxID=328185 RepID=A0AAW2IHL1_9NEOP